ncbi:MAG: hypothetical protein JNK72_13795 [Myxococcales bacterium]|nr:hypothetical protein [Myxococcales bacterium]
MWSTPSGAVDIRGSLQGVDTLAPSPRPDPPRYRGSYWDTPNGALTPITPRASVERDIGVVVTGPGIAEATQAMTVPVEGNRCRPGTVVVSPGTTLTLDNQDLVSHTLYAIARGQEANRVVQPETTSARTRRQITFAAPGTYELRDERSPAFRCWVVVGQGQGRVLGVNREGAFMASNLNEGAYVVRAYFEGTERGSVNATVANEAVTVQLPVSGAPTPAAANNAAPAGNTPPAPSAANNDSDGSHRGRHHR